MVNHLPTCSTCQRCMSLKGRMGLPIEGGGGGRPTPISLVEYKVRLVKQTTPQTVFKLGSQNEQPSRLPETMHELGYPG